VSIQAHKASLQLCVQHSLPALTEQLRAGHVQCLLMQYHRVLDQSQTKGQNVSQGGRDLFHMRL